MNKNALLNHLIKFADRNFPESNDGTQELLKTFDGYLVLLTSNISKKLTDQNAIRQTFDSVGLKMVNCPDCGSHVVIEHITCPFCGSGLLESAGKEDVVVEPVIEQKAVVAEKKSKVKVKKDATPVGATAEAPKPAKAAPVAKALEPVETVDADEIIYPTTKKIIEMSREELLVVIKKFDLKVDKKLKAHDLKVAVDKAIEARLQEEENEVVAEAPKKVKKEKPSKVDSLPEEPDDSFEKELESGLSDEDDDSDEEFYEKAVIDDSDIEDEEVDEDDIENLDIDLDGISDEEIEEDADQDDEDDFGWDD